MGTFEQGYMGPFRGKLGTAVGSKWKGLYVLRSRPPRKRTGPASESQLEVQAKFLLMTKFLRPLTDLLNQTFKKSAVNMSGANKAFAENKKAVTGAYPDFTIDYAKVILSTGNFDNAGGPAAKSAEAGKLVFTWTDNSNAAKNADLRPGLRGGLQRGAEQLDLRAESGDEKCGHIHAGCCRVQR